MPCTDILSSPRKSSSSVYAVQIALMHKHQSQQMCGVDHSFQFHLVNFSLSVNANIALLIVPNESLFTCNAFFFLAILDRVSAGPTWHFYTEHRGFPLVSHPETQATFCNFGSSDIKHCELHLFFEMCFVGSLISLLHWSVWFIFNKCFNKINLYYTDLFSFVASLWRPLVSTWVTP